jgi:hypothetical protein
MAPPRLRQIRRTIAAPYPQRHDDAPTPYAFAVEIRQPAGDDGPTLVVVLCPWCGERETHPLNGTPSHAPRLCLSGDTVRDYLLAVPAQVPIMAPALAFEPRA